MIVWWMVGNLACRARLVGHVGRWRVSGGDGEVGCSSGERGSDWLYGSFGGF